MQLARDTHAKARGAELQLGVLVAERAGNFIRRYEAEVTLKAR